MDGWNLFHGNQSLAGLVIRYDPATRFRQSDHTLSNILLALDRTFTNPDGRQKNKARLAEYLVLVSGLAREFVIAFVRYNLQEPRKIRL